MLYPEVLLERVASGNPELSRQQLSYVIETTPHRSERMLIHDRHGKPIAVCRWAYGERETQMRGSIELCMTLRQEHPSLTGILPEFLFVGSIAGRYTAAYRWRMGVSLLRYAKTVQGRQMALDTAFDTLLAFQALTAEQGAFTSQHFYTHAQKAASQLACLQILDSQSRNILTSVENSLQALVGSSVWIGPVHRDYEFGNLIRCNDGDISIVDWDMAIQNAPCFIDYAHLMIAYGVNASGLSYPQAVGELFTVGGELYELQMHYTERYLGHFPQIEPTTRLLVGLTVLMDLESYATRVYWAGISDLWANYLISLDRILSDE